MIRHDYLLAWIRRYVQWLMEITGLVKREDWEAALRRAEVALRALLDLGTDSVLSLSEGEILARLTMGEPPPVVQEKCLVLAALLHQLGKIAAGQGQEVRARDSQLKALHILLGLQMRPDAAPRPEYAPSIDEVLAELKGHELPPRTHAALMIHHEQAGRFGKAEDAVFELLRTSGDDPESIALGEAFYQRLLVLSEEALTLGGLPRAEAEEGLATLRARAAGPSRPAA